MLKIFVICLIAVTLVCLISIWHASTHFHKVYYRLSSDKLREPVKFVLLADLHDKEYGLGNQKLLDAIREEKPNAVLIAGDMLTAHGDRACHVAEELVAALAEQYPVYYGFGNHEAKMLWDEAQYGTGYQGYMDTLHGLGVTVLNNTVCQFGNRPIRIYGLNMAQRYFKRFKRLPMEADYLTKTLGTFDDSYYNILLAHNPAYFEEYADLKPDLVLSGHVHGGLVRLPFLGGVIAPSLQLFPKYDGGRFTKGDSTMILSRGLGFHSIEFRMWNPGELVVIELVPTENK